VLVAEQEEKNRLSCAGRDNRFSAEISDRLLGLPTLLWNVQGGSNMTGTDLCLNKPHYAAAVRP